MTASTYRPSGFDEDALLAAVDVVGRSGATGFECGYLHDEPTRHDWYAHAQYRGARITVEHHDGPVEASEALARRILNGATCTNCYRLVALQGDGDDITCRWTRNGRRWHRGCEDERIGIAERRRRAQEHIS